MATCTINEAERRKPADQNTLWKGRCLPRNSHHFRGSALKRVTAIIGAQIKMRCPIPPSVTAVGTRSLAAFACLACIILSRCRSRRTACSKPANALIVRSILSVAFPDSSRIPGFPSGNRWKRRLLSGYQSHHEDVSGSGPLQKGRRKQSPLSLPPCFSTVLSNSSKPGGAVSLELEQSAKTRLRLAPKLRLVRVRAVICVHPCLMSD